MKIKKKSYLKRFFSALGPGLVTGAADDDPSGIATYSIAGAQLGTSLLWMSWVTWPLMTFVQMMCARIGMVTGEGLGSALSRKLPGPVLRMVCVALWLANTINIAADLSGMADAANLLTGWSSHLFVVAFGIGITAAVIWLRYNCIANVLKWLAMTLLAYVVTAFILHPDWSVVAQQTFSFTFAKDKKTLETIVAILGTTISPYLFFWQAAQEIEEEKCQGKRTVAERRGASPMDLFDRRMDVGAGTFLSNIVMFFIILTTALTLHAHGMTAITTSKEVAEALKPLAGSLATLLYTVGVVTVGILAIPTLAGSAAYAFAETFNWSEGLDEKLSGAKAFYAVIVVAMVCGMGLDFVKINPIRALYWSAVINGVLAPFLMAGILWVARDEKLMAGQPSPVFNQIIVGITTVLMFLAVIAMIAV